MPRIAPLALVLAAPLWADTGASLHARAAPVSERAAQDPRAQVRARLAAAEGLEQARDWKGAAAAFEQAVDEAAALDRPADLHAEASEAAGRFYFDRGDLVPAGRHFAAALRQRERHEPGSLATARARFWLGTVRANMGAMDDARALFAAARAVQETLEPQGSAALGETLTWQAALALRRGDLRLADATLQAARQQLERYAPRSLALSAAWRVEGDLAAARGQGVQAERLQERMLALRRELAPDSRYTASALHALGAAAELRTDLPLAAAYYELALAVSERAGLHVSQRVAGWAGLANLACRRRDFAACLEQIRAARQATGRVALPLVVQFQLDLVEGMVLVALGRPGEAEPLLRAALALAERHMPESTMLGDALLFLGEVEESAGRLAAAESLYTRSLALRERLVAASHYLADAWLHLARLADRQGRGGAALEFSQRALEVIEDQALHADQSHAGRAAFLSVMVHYHRHQIDALARLGRGAEAFALLERSRGRWLRAWLEQQQLLGTQSDSLRAAWRAAEGEYLWAHAAATRLVDEAGIEARFAALDALRAARERRDTLAVQAAASHGEPASAAAEPPVLDLAAVQAALEPGTLLLAYSVGPERTWLFVVEGSARPGLWVFEVPLGSAGLQAQVEAWRHAVVAESESAEPARRASGAEADATARALFDLLVAPAGPQVERSRRLLILADGPLQRLPFGALVVTARAGPRAPAGRYLVEWRPWHTSPSASVYARRLTRTAIGRERRSQIHLAAFGDPPLPELSAPAAAPVLARAARWLGRRGALGPLPSARREVRRILAVQRARERALAYLGDEASEARVKALPRDVRYLHFASHGLVDEQQPYESALLLGPSTDPAEDGLLHAWEVLGQISLDAELVTLSACDSGLGRDLGGEGLVGLTRAFQHAGARAVLASLWSVGDDATAELMARFYRHLARGRRKDEALQRAQIEALRGFAGAPFHWAAFQLSGDPR